MNQPVRDRSQTRMNQGHALDASVAIRSKISLTNELRIAIALFEIPVSGWTCLRTTMKIFQHRLAIDVQLWSEVFDAPL